MQSAHVRGLGFNCCSGNNARQAGLCKVKSISLCETFQPDRTCLEVRGEGSLWSQIMEDQHSVESARKDLDVIFTKINNNLKEFQSKSGPPEQDVEKTTKSEVSFQIDDHEEQNKKKVSYTPEFTSLPFRRYKYLNIDISLCSVSCHVLEVMGQR